MGVGAYFIGLYNAPMALNEKGYYFTIMLFGLFSVVSLQKTVRDKMEGVPATKAYFLASAVATASAVVLLVIGLLNAELLLSEKGFFGMAFTLSLFCRYYGASAIESRNTKSDTQSIVEHEIPKWKAA